MYLTLAMRDMLIEHIDGRVAYLPEGSANNHRVVAGLVKRGLLRFDRPISPRWTALTEAGRARVAHILAEYAEALVKAGFGAQPLEAEDCPRTAAALERYLMRRRVKSIDNAMAPAKECVHHVTVDD